MLSPKDTLVFGGNFLHSFGIVRQNQYGDIFLVPLFVSLSLSVYMCVCMCACADVCAHVHVCTLVYM